MYKMTMERYTSETPEKKKTFLRVAAHRLSNFLLMVAMHDCSTTILYLQGLLHYNTRTKYLEEAPH